MAEPRLISPMLDGFMMSNPISEHHGVCCCPAINTETDEKYIVKVISVPATPSQMEALLLSGAYTDEESALSYYKELADSVLKEVTVLKDLSELEGFVPYTDCQIVPMESGKGYEIYLLGSYKRSLAKHFKRHIFTHLDALNLGLDLCAALSVSRRNGYLYVDLKPDNVFVTDQRLFRIGDLGFVRLDSLKYASLPDKYFSVYTPPEVRDAFSDLNSTMDVYAAGLILYQTYNNGELPFNSEIRPGDKLPAPLYADYEMSEIILKACDPNPDNRWQDPMQMGQAIVSYMQRNGALDVPIIPMPVQEDNSQDDEGTTTENVVPEQALEATEKETVLQPDADTATGTEDNNQADVPEEVSESEEADLSTNEVLDELALLTDDTDEDVESEEVEADYDTLSEDVSEILNQADELADMDVPEPVVVPDYVEITMPEPIVPEEVEPEEPEETEVTEEVEENSEEDDKELNEESEESQDVWEDTEFDAPVKERHWLRNTIIAVIVLALLAGGIYFYKNFYLLPIEFIAVEGNNDTLTVLVTTDIDESLLQVICSDTYGNKIHAPVINGKAEFDSLVPNTAYSIKVVAKGFHRLTGRATAAYSTPIQTNIVQFDAIAGSTEDSVILSFTAEGPNCDEWTVYYTAEGEEERSAVFMDTHMITLTNLTVGKEYTFRLTPKQELYITGQSEITFTPRQLVRAQQLIASSFLNNALTVKWSAPDGENVSSWSVRCYNEAYNQTMITSDTFVTFQPLDPNAEYNIEVKAVGMSVGEKIVIPANSVTVSNFSIDTSDPTKLTLIWDPSQPISADGWVLRYSVVGLGNEVVIRCDQNTAVINSLIPNATYRIQIEDINGTVLLGSKTEVTTGAAVDFSKEFEHFNVSRSDLNFYMCRTPKRPNWGRYDLADSDYTTTFAVGESASFLVRANKNCFTSSENITTMYVVYDQSGMPIFTAQDTRTWSNMWSNYNCKLEIPVMPTEAGNYTIEVYFNGGLVNSQSFTIQ